MAIHRGKLLLEIFGLLIGGFAVLCFCLILRVTEGSVRLDFLQPFISARLSTSLGMQVDFAHLSMGANGWGTPIDVEVRDVRLTSPDGLNVLQVPVVDAQFSFRSLFHHGLARILSVRLTHPQLTAREDPDGSYHFRKSTKTDDQPQPTTGDPLKQLLSPPKDSPISRWTELSIKDGEASLADPGGVSRLHIESIELSLARKAEGATLNLAGVVDGADGNGSLFAFAQFDESERGQLKLHVTPIPINIVAGIVPDLQAASGLKIAASIELTAEMTGLKPDAAKLDVTIGPGQIDEPAYLPVPLDLKSGHIAATYTGMPESLKIDDFHLIFDGPELAITGSAATTQGVVKASADVTLSDLPIDYFPQYWPADISPGGRAWVFANLSKGSLSQATAHLVATAPRDDLGNVDIAGVNGAMSVAGANVHYFGQLPSATGVDATIDYDQHQMTIHPTSGDAAGLKLTDGQIVIDGFDQPVQNIGISLVLSGSVASAFTILDAAPLHYAHKLKIDPKSVGGSAVTQFHIGFPLTADLEMNQLDLHTDTALTRVSLPNVVHGLSLHELDGRLLVNTDGLLLDGRAMLGQTPLNLEFRQAFDTSIKPTSTASFDAEIGDAGRQELGIAAPDRLTGPVKVKGDYADSGATSTVNVHADLTPADLKIDEIAYRKAAGVAGKADLSLQLANGALHAIDGISVDAPNFQLQGNVELDPVTGKLTRLHLDPLHVFSGTMALDMTPLPSGGSKLALSGAVLDARAFLHQHRQPVADDQSVATDDNLPLEIDADIGWVQTSDGTGLRNVKGSILLHGKQWMNAAFTADAAGHQISLSYLPEGDPANPSYVLRGDTDDAGAALAGLALTNSITGGALHLEGGTAASTNEIPNPPLTGTLTVHDFTVSKPPIFAKLFDLLSVKGFMETLSGQGIQFKSLSTGFEIQNGIIRLKDGKLEGASIGLTVDGSVDRRAETLDLHGAAIPAYGVNTLVRNVPLLGYLLAGSNGEGVFSTPYNISGPLDDPSVFINPVGLLAPGVLRDVLFEWPWNTD